MNLTPKQRMAVPRQAMPQRDPHERAREFVEVNIGFGPDQAQKEAQRCLHCTDAPCAHGCPVGLDVPAFLHEIESGDLEAASRILFRDNALPAITGRVCPQEIQCEGACIRGRRGAPVAIGHLERFVADWARGQRGATHAHVALTGGNVAIVGSGPAGLTAAIELAQRGHHVTVFEALHALGGVLRYGIPEFRLPNAILDEEVDRLKSAGVAFVTNFIVGKTATVSELLDQSGHDAVFIATGAGVPRFLNIPGESLTGVYSANEFLTRVNLMGAGRDPHSDTPVLAAKHAVVIGGGNTAMDSIRTALRLGANDATIVYRRAFEDMPARIEEIRHAQEEGVEMLTHVSPTRILGDKSGRAYAMECVRMQPGEPDDTARRRPTPIEGSEIVIDCDIVIEAIGTRANPLLASTTPEIRRNSSGYIVVDQHCASSMPGVYAGGDAIRGSATVILAMGDGKRAARSIDAYLHRVDQSAA